MGPESSPRTSTVATRPGSGGLLRPTFVGLLLCTSFAAAFSTGVCPATGNRYPGGPSCRFHLLSASRNVPYTEVDSTFEVLLCSLRDVMLYLTAQTPELVDEPDAVLAERSSGVRCLSLQQSSEFPQSPLGVIGLLYDSCPRN